MAERAQHRLGQRHLVPRSVVATAVDEERRRQAHAAGARARRCPRRRASPARSRRDASSAGSPNSAATASRSSSVSACERVISSTCASQNARSSGADSARSPRGARARAGDRALAEHVAQAIAEAIAELRDLLVGGAAVRARVAAVFDQREVGASGAEHMVAARIDRVVELVVSSRHRIGRVKRKRRSVAFACRAKAAAPKVGTATPRRPSATAQPHATASDPTP